MQPEDDEIIVIPEAVSVWDGGCRAESHNLERPNGRESRRSRALLLSLVQECGRRPVLSRQSLTTQEDDESLPPPSGGPQGHP